MQFSADPIWPWPVVAALAVALLALVVGTYRLQWRTVAPHRRLWLLGSKIAAVVVLVWAMFRPQVQFTDKDDNALQLLVAVDVSRSMNTSDCTGGLSRFQAVRQDLERHSARWQALSERVALRKFEFAQQLQEFRPDLASADGDQTALGQTLDDLIREARRQRTLAVLLLSDGAQRALPPNDLDPLTAARGFAEVQAPIYTIGYGTTSLSTGALDLAVQDLLVDPVVFEKKLVPIKVQLKAIGAAGRKVAVRVLLEDRGNKPFGEAGELRPAPATAGARTVQEITLARNSETVPVELSFIPDRPGELKVAVEVQRTDGELLERNNRLETIITVRQGGLRVAYFDMPRLEQRVIKMVNGADKIQLDYYEIRGGKFRTQTVIDPTAFDRGRYDVYMIGDVPAEVFGQALLTQLSARVQEGAGLLMIGGLHNFSAGGYAGTPLADWLPVVLVPGAVAAPGGDPQSQYSGPQPMLPTATGLKRYVMQLDTPDRNRARWERLAPLVGATRLQPKHELVEVWAETKAGAPLLLVAPQVGMARVAAFAGDTTYQWVSHGQAEEHQRFWRQLILWLARKEADTDQAVWVKVEPRNFVPGATVPLEFGAREPNGVPLTDVEFQVQITGPEGQPVDIPVRKTAESFAADFAQTQRPGDYWVRVTGQRNGVASYGQTRFVVDPKDLELDQPNADYDMLRQIAELTNGQMLRSEDLDALLERLQNLKLDDLERVRVLPLWDNWWLLLVFVGLLTVEWTIRKKSGLA